MIYKWRQEARAERAPTFVAAVLPNHTAFPCGADAGRCGDTIELPCGARVCIWLGRRRRRWWTRDAASRLR